MSFDTITRPAVSRPASLGDLYDIRTESFKDIMILKKHPIPTSIIKTVQCPRVDMQFLKTESFSEKFGKLKVSADFTLSLLAGYVPLTSATGKYLQEEKASSRAVTTTMMYSMETVVDTLNINSEELEEIICQKTISETDATHVVIRVDWGATVFISFQDTSGNGNSNYDLSNKVEATFKNLVSTVNSSHNGTTEDKMEQLSLRVYGDISPENGFPQTAQEAMDFIQTVPKLAKESNNGKGKPISYGLVPISVIRKKFGIASETILWQEVDDDVSQQILYCFDHLLKLKQKLTDFYEDVEQYSYCLGEQNVAQVTKKQQELAIFERQAKNRLKEIISKVRGGQGDKNAFEDILRDLNKNTVDDASKDSRNQLVQIQEYLKSKGEVAENILWIKTLISQNVLPIGTGEIKTIDAAIVGKPSGDDQVNKVFVYAFSSQKKEQENRLSKNQNLFLQLLSSQEKKAKFYFINSDIHPMDGSTTGTVKKSSIYRFNNGNLESDDWLEETEKKMKIPIVGTYKLKDNGQFGTYLTDLGVRGVRYYGILAANCTLVITENDGLYKIDAKTTFITITQTFRLDKEVSGWTAIDGQEVQSLVTRKLNRLILKETLKDGAQRITIREFLKDKLIVTLKLLPGKYSGKNITVMRTFDRIK